MAHYRKMRFVLCLSVLMVAVVTGYYFWHRHYIQPFLCQVSFIQHHSDETLSLWLNYTVDGDNGMLSMNGRVKSDPTKTIDRKIFFQVERKDRIYHLKSVRNMKFPDDNVSDSWLEKYEPLFFIYPNESLYMRIKKQDNNNYLFILGTLPTYVCHISKTES